MALGDHPKKLATISFLLIAATFGVMTRNMLVSIPDPPFAPKPDEHAFQPPAPGIMRVEVPLPNALLISLPLDPPVQVQIYLAATASGPLEQLASLKPRVESEAPRIEAALLKLAQSEVEKNHDPAHLHKVLPAPMRDIANGILGTPEVPEPVSEVLIIGLSVQGG